MRWFKFLLLGLVVLLILYAVATSLFIDENKTLRVEKEVPYSADKVYLQFSNLQNFARWSALIPETKSTYLEFYQPYTGVGSSMSYTDNSESGDLTIWYENEGKTIKYNLFQDENVSATLIEVRFIPLSAEKTKVIWKMVTPKKNWLNRITNLWTETDFIENVDKSTTKLLATLSNKIDKDQLLTNLKYDSLVVENVEEQLLLGVNVTSSNKKDALFQNILMNYSKVTNFVTTDLNKREDEIGFPIMLSNTSESKSKEVSYFLGIPLSKKVAVSDNNFSYKTLNESKAYAVFFKGEYQNRWKSIQILLQKAKKDTMKYDELQEVFLETPQSEKEVLMKLTLPVHK